MGARVPESMARDGRFRDDELDSPGGVGLRPMEADDVARVGTIERASFSRPWKEETFRDLLGRERSELWVADDVEDGVVGYFVLWWIRDEAELANIAVDPERRRRGIGALLLDRAAERARARGAGSLFLEVRASNETALTLYRNRGFHVVTTRRNYYDSPVEDALVMVRSLW